MRQRQKRKVVAVAFLLHEDRSHIECTAKVRYLSRMNAEFAPLLKLARAERLQLVEDLWDSIAQEDAQSPVPDLKRDELRRRKERFAAHPASGRTWEQVKQRARSQHD
jgi:putative addiction module component (TIGR02574 family)